ncbi:DUF1360 domain-containing protein [Streptomyces sp. NBC_01304]|uniref:DUF1360 domain-containing protein n=1 Tax=Streptomyces sp. NBC_01304 TaxID=2903818 RepID=UPI002E12AD6A|nr:DUF1360 domain-containing protein [Streptomyces sp. NBC_01304]
MVLSYAALHAALALALARVLRVLSHDTITNRLRETLLTRQVAKTRLVMPERTDTAALIDTAQKRGLYGFLTCAWCAGFWLTAAAVPVLWTLSGITPGPWTSLPTWAWYALTVLAVSELTGLIARHHQPGDKK